MQRQRERRQEEMAAMVVSAVVDRHARDRTVQCCSLHYTALHCRVPEAENCMPLSTVTL